MERRNISGHSPFEAQFGYSRAVAFGDRVVVGGTAPIAADGSPPPADAYGQAKLCLDLIAEALGKAGADLAHVVRTRIFLTNVADAHEVSRAHGDVFMQVRPVCTAVVVKELLDPAWLVEIEAEAVIPQSPDATT
jgi:enamine deaminase RidA (YjgF/YER057c/UK114 family)